MTLSEYREEIKRTLNTHDNTDVHMIMGMLGEAGEFIDQLKKMLFQGHKEPTFKEELGDLLWYVCNYANYLDYEITEENPTQMFIYHRETTFSEFIAMEDEILTIAGLYNNAKLTVYPLKHVCYLLQKIYSRIVHLASQVDLDIADIREANIAKLRLRYPNSFETERSVNRCV